MSTQPSPLTPSRVVPNTWHAFGGIWRLTWKRFIAPRELLGVVGLVVLVCGPLSAIMRDSQVKAADPSAMARFYFQWASNFYLTFLAPILAFLTAASAMREEMKSVSADYVLTRPVRRPVFVVFKFMSHLVCTQASYLVALAALVAVGLYRQVPLVLPSLPWLLAGQLTVVTAFSAFGFMCAVLSSRYLIIGLVYAGIVEYAVGNIPTQLNHISMTHQVKMLLHPIRVWWTPELKPEQPALTCVLVLLAFSVVTLAVAATVFNFLQLSGSRANEG